MKLFWILLFLLYLSVELRSWLAERRSAQAPTLEEEDLPTGYAELTLLQKRTWLRLEMVKVEKQIAEGKADQTKGDVSTLPLDTQHD